jgi:hydroxypyruvate isomerase
VIRIVSRGSGENVPVALELARSLGCRRMNILAGHALPGMEREEQLDLARNNVGFAVDEARAAGVEVVVEAVNTFENGRTSCTRRRRLWSSCGALGGRT